jgi:hypothetical protein
MSVFGDVWNGLKDVAGDVGDAASSVAHGLADAARAIADFVSNPDELLSALKRIATFLGDTYVGYLLGGLAGETLLQIANVLGFSTVEQLYNFLHNLRVVPRSLRPEEEGLLNSVINDLPYQSSRSVPGEKIRLTPLTGIDHRWMTVPTSILAFPLARFFLPDGTFDALYAMAAVTGVLFSDAYLVNVGPDAYDHGATYTDDASFVHECTHVWQGLHWPGGPFNWNYALDAIFHRNYNFDYDPSRQWNSYSAEQQAQIVQEWYTGSDKRPTSPPHLIPAMGGVPSHMSPGINPPYVRMDLHNPSYRFVKNNLWPGDQDAFSDESVLADQSVSLAALVAGSGTPGIDPNSGAIPSSSGAPPHGTTAQHHLVSNRKYVYP